MYLVSNIYHHLPSNESWEPLAHKRVSIYLLLRWFVSKKRPPSVCVLVPVYSGTSLHPFRSPCV